MALTPSETSSSVVLVLALCTAYIVINSLLSNYNKFLMQRFPYPTELTAIHMFCSWVLSSLLYMVFPELFPAMSRVQGRKKELLKYMAPVGVLFTLALFASNVAFEYCGKAFLRFMKESNILIVFFVSCTVGLQRLDRVRVFIVLWVLVGSILGVDGEMHFLLVGFLVQGFAQVARCCEYVLAELIMTSTDFKLDPLTYTLFVSPVVLCCLVIFVPFTWHDEVAVALPENWQFLLANACFAFCLNATIAAMLKNCSAVGFIFATTVKDIAFVFSSSVLDGEIITHTQYSGYTVAFGGIAAWCLLKLNPSGAVATSLSKMLCVPGVSGMRGVEGRGETLPLVVHK